MLNSLCRKLASPGLNLLLLGLLTLAMMAGGTLPQSRRLTSADYNDWRNRWPNLSEWIEWSGLGDVYAAPWFAALALGLTLNLAAAMALYLLRVRAWRAGKSPPTHQLQGQGKVPPHVIAATGFRRDGVHLTGTAGLWGIPVLHAGIALIIIAALVIRSERFAAHLELAEGEIFHGQPDKLVIDGNRETTPEMRFGLRIEALEIVVAEENQLRELNARVSVREPGKTDRLELLRVNAPLEVGDHQVYLDKTFGWTAVFDRVRPGGEQVRLLINFPASKTQWARLAPLTRQTTVSLDNYPLVFDMALAAGDSPRFSLAAAQQGVNVFNGKLAPGETADLGHYQLTFRGIIPWAGLYLTRDSGTSVIFAGYVMALVGALLPLLFRPRRVLLVNTDESWSLMAWVMPGDLALERKWESLAIQSRQADTVSR